MPYQRFSTLESHSMYFKTLGDIVLVHATWRFENVCKQRHKLHIDDWREHITRPCGPSLFWTKPIDHDVFDHIDMGMGWPGESYVLMIQHNPSGYTVSYPVTVTRDKYLLMIQHNPSRYICIDNVRGTVATQSALAVIDCFVPFKIFETFMSDEPTRFKCQAIRVLTKWLQVRHHFMLLYYPWTKGAIEHVGKKILRNYRALRYEWKLLPRFWWELLPVF